MTSLHFHPLTVKSVRPDTDEAVIVSFDVPEDLRDAFGFTQGQYLTLRNNIDGSDLRRSYSICSGVDDGELRVGVRKVPGGAFSNWINESLKPGDTIQVMAPQGRFFVPLEPERRAPLPRHRRRQRHHADPLDHEDRARREPGSRFTLIYGNRKLRSTMFKEELEDLKNRYLSRLMLHHVFSQEPTDLPLYGGRIGREKIGEFLGTLVDPAVDRPRLRLRPARHERRGRGGAARRRRAGRAHPHRALRHPRAAGVKAVQPVREGDAADAQVTIIRDGVQREIDFHAHQGSILDAAAAAGLEVPFSCTSGVCCTCRAKLLEGEVRMERNFALEKHEVAAGFVLTCQAHPLTERVVLSFDER